jgi:hypothetical protein
MFSLEKANALLPELERILDELLRKKERHERSHDALLMHELVVKAEKHSGAAVETLECDQAAKMLEFDLADFEKTIMQIRSLGCILRNVEKGWVDFLGERHGKPVYFCWKRGEKAIQYYHPFKGSMNERLPLFSEEPVKACE